MTKVIAWIDEDDIIDPVVRPLTRAGYKIERFRSLAHAKKAKTQILESDLILLDLILDPHRPTDRYAGLSFLRELVDNQEHIPPVVVFTVVTDEQVLKDLNKLGVAAIVQKPSAPSHLKEVVEKILIDPS